MTAKLLNSELDKGNAAMQRINADSTESDNPGVATFSAFTTAVRCLRDWGWTESDLKKEIENVFK
jgi:hypothetical protein